MVTAGKFRAAVSRMFHRTAGPVRIFRHSVVDIAAGHASRLLRRLLQVNRRLRHHHNRLDADRLN